MNEDEENELDKQLSLFLVAYGSSLYTRMGETAVAESYWATQELNKARSAEGLGKISYNSTKLINEALKDAKEYRKLLEEKNGSYVVKKIDGTEKLVFEPWLKGLQEDIKKEIIDIFDLATKENWSQQKIGSELAKLEDSMISKRVRATAFSETRGQQFRTTMKIWKNGDVRQVQRHVNSTNPCKPCDDMDGQIYSIDEAPPLSHVGCLCSYSIYGFESEEVD